MSSLLFVSVVSTLFSLLYCRNVIDVNKFGADVKGVKKSTNAISKAIEEAVTKGGGDVHFPAGVYLTGPIHLKTNVTLTLDEKTTIKFSTDFDDYLPMVRMRWEGTVINNFSPLIYAYKQENIGIKGKGTIDGQGSVWWNEYHKLKDLWTKSKVRNTKYQKEFLRMNNLKEMNKTDDTSRMEFAFLRPPFVQFYECKNILIEGIHVKNSPFWNLNPVFSDDIVIKDVTITATVPSPNTDGIDPDSCRNVIISNVTIDVGDDCIAVKSGRDAQGRSFGRPSENILIEKSHMLRGVAGVAIGSEGSGGIRNVTVRDCNFHGTSRGLFIKSTRGRGGVTEHIRFHNVTMTNLGNEAFLFTMIYPLSYFYTPGDKMPYNRTGKREPFTDKTPIFRDIEVSGIKGNAQHSIVISGLPESLIENIQFKDIDLKSKFGLVSNYTTNIQINEYSQKN